jgi:integrase
MARHVKLAVRKDTWTNKEGDEVAHWRVAVPPSLSQNGRRENRYFATKAEAQVFAGDLKERKARFGSLASYLTAQQVAEASAAIQVLAPTGASLLDAAREYLVLHSARNQSATVAALFDQFANLSGTKPARRSNIRYARDCFGDQSKLVCNLSSGDVEAALQGKTPGAWCSHFNVISAALNYGKKKGYLGVNPCESIDRIRPEKPPTQIAAPETVAALLAHADQNEVDMIPFLVFTFFCGIRPGDAGEISKLDWSHVGAGSVVLPGGITKTGHKREVPLSGNAVAWLDRYVALGGKREGLVVKWPSSQLERKRSANWKSAGFEKIPKDAARHSFCSYFLAHTGSLDRSLLASGHTQSRMFWDHYYQHATTEQTAAFWSIVPG